MSKTSRYLYPHEAQMLGFDIKKNEVGRKNARYQVKESDWEKVKDSRNSEEKTETVVNDYNEKKPFVLSAWGDNGRMMDIDKYCEYYNLPRNTISSYKLVTHTGVPYYNIAYGKVSTENEIDIDSIKSILNSELNKVYYYEPKSFTQPQETVLKWADLHFGAHIRNLLLTKDYDSTILRDSLLQSVFQVNSLGYKKVHIHLMGDLIESFSGLNHINSWMSLDKDEVGAMAIKLCTKLLHEVFSKVKNLGSIKIVSGNHDRLSKNNDEDVKGGAAELISWGLELMGYDIEFHPYIITHKVEGINHINLHGDKGISKKSTEDILWKYGEKGVFNFIFEAHLHSIIQKLSVSQRTKFRTVKDDALDHRRMHCPSFFTGNYYSETLGYNSNAGYVLVSDNGKGLPNVFQMAI